MIKTYLDPRTRTGNAADSCDLCICTGRLQSQIHLIYLAQIRYIIIHAVANTMSSSSAVRRSFPTSSLTNTEQPTPPKKGVGKYARRRTGGMAVSQVLQMALLSRFVTLVLMLLQDGLFEDLSSSSHLQPYPCRQAGEKNSPEAVPQTSKLDAIAESTFSPWDGVYFTRIAQCGYESDQVFAFFPLLPLLMRCGGIVLKAISGICMTENFFFLHERLLLILSGILLNVIAFCGAALALYRLGRHVFHRTQDEDLVSLSVLLFCWNPASVFYSALYTESLFACCTWMGLLGVLKAKRIGNACYWKGVVWLTLASAARSNGTLAVWYLLHRCMKELINKRDKCLKNTCAILMWTGMASTMVLLPYIGMQVYGYEVFCQNREQQTPEWCRFSFPSIYSYVQNTYWDVGFLNFYEKLIRLPFVIQSIPVLALSVSACWIWTSSSLKRAISLSLYSTKMSKKVYNGRKHPGGITEDSVGPFVYHLALMTAVAIFVMHVNVATRFLSSNPLVFWYSSQLILNGSPKVGYTIWGWFLSYLLVGTLMFSNFYPWT